MRTKALEKNFDVYIDKDTAGQLAIEWGNLTTEERNKILRKSGLSTTLATQEFGMIIKGMSKKGIKDIAKAIVDINIDVKEIRLRFSDNKERLVPFITPMRPNISAEEIPNKGYTAEEKKDGTLTFQYIEDGAIAYVNRHGRNKTSIYPELTDDEPKKIRTTGLTITQGETYVFKGGKDVFEDFLKRDLLQNPEEAKRRAGVYPLTYEAFDIVMKDGEWTSHLPIEERRKLLKETLPENLKDVKITKYSTSPVKFTTKMRKDDTVEGVVLKKDESLYRSDKQKDWEKVKFVKEADVVIMGYSPGQGRREGSFGTLQVGIWDPKQKKVVLVGNPGTGFNDDQLTDIKKRLDKGEKLFAKVEYMKMGSQGRMRMPSFKGLRSDIESVKETHL